jgi:hypothetical protein
LLSFDTGCERLADMFNFIHHRKIYAGAGALF